MSAHILLYIYTELCIIRWMYRYVLNERKKNIDLWELLAGLRVVLKFHSCSEIPEISQLSWNCPEISSCPEILLIWSECPDMDLCYAVTTLFFTSHDYVYVADVECQVMFSLVTLYCSMCNIALVSFLWLQYWSASMINIYECRKTYIFCVLSLMKPTKVSWNFLKIWSWNFTSCCWEPWQCKDAADQVMYKDRDWRNYTVSQKNWGMHIMPHNFRKCGPILIILSLLHTQMNCRKRLNKFYCLTSNLLPHYHLSVYHPNKFDCYRVLANMNE